jgi:hypothetical protein
VLLSAAAAALVFGAVTAFAGSGVGAVFNLGQANTVNGTSSLSGSTAGPQLKVTNTNSANQAITAVAGSGTGIALYGSHSGSTGTGAAVRGQTASAAGPGVLGVNTGGGPALQATVNAGVAPLKVNSSAKVANLNSDQLDGHDSTYYLPATGTAADAAKLGGSPPSDYEGACLSGMTLVGAARDLCVDSTNRATQKNWFDSATICRDAGLRLPSVSEALEAHSVLDAAAGSNEEYWTDQIWDYSYVSGGQNVLLNMGWVYRSGAGIASEPREVIGGKAVRCVATPSDAG